MIPGFTMAYTRDKCRNPGRTIMSVKKKKAHSPNISVIEVFAG